MHMLALLSALGLNATFETFVWWVFLYFCAFHVILPFLGELTRNCIRAAARAAINKARRILTRQKYD